ncbi:MAG: hypothetical protein KJP00_03035 [Bacteroidia bacterium]|nr:hypothetical protein [Bacteroidia bacterium]
MEYIGRRFLLLFFISFSINISYSQNPDSLGNTATQLLNKSGKLNIGGYAGIHFNQPLNGDLRQNGTVDVHRLVMLFGYNFDPNLSFITEIEFEHVKEVFVEQAFVNYRIKPWMNFRAGLLLIPMGIVNEFHEPTTFLGVERPTLDKYIVPSTWREIGLGLQGNIIDASLSYQFYLVNGFASYDGQGKLKGSSGLRGGRQKGAEAIMTSPNFTGKISYYGIRGLNLGLSLYTGNSQTSLYDGMDQSNPLEVNRADSSRIQTTMLGLDVRYTYKGLKLRGQFNSARLGNTLEYNSFTSADMGSRISGYYFEAAYDLLRAVNANSQLFPFVRYEHLNTHASTEGELQANKAYHLTTTTIGIDWVLSNGVAFKADYQFLKNKGQNSGTNQLNLGVGVWFR